MKMAPTTFRRSRRAISKVLCFQRRTEAEQNAVQPPPVQITCVSISKRMTTTGTPSNHRMIGISSSNLSQPGSIAFPYNVGPAVKFPRKARDGTRYSSARKHPSRARSFMPNGKTRISSMKGTNRGRAA
jgi:hypothetical protein